MNARARRIAARLLVLALVLATVQAVTGVSLVGSPAPAHSPYSSALTAVGFGQAFAAPYCNNKACVGGSRFNLSCGTIDTPYHCEKFGRNLCSQAPC